MVTEQQVDLSPGLNVVTGESGSGKSVLLAALGQALGAPADDFIRPPSETAAVQAAFILSAAGIVSSFQSMPICMRRYRRCTQHWSKSKFLAGSLHDGCADILSGRMPGVKMQLYPDLSSHQDEPYPAAAVTQHKPMPLLARSCCLLQHMTFIVMARQRFCIVDELL